MQNKHQTQQTEDLDRYTQLFAPYEQQLSDFTVREGEYGGRFALLFRQVVRLLVQDNAINPLMPKMYTAVAHRYLERDPDTVRHFSYEDNRHFFLSELREWLAVRERGHKMRQMRRPGE